MHSVHLHTVDAASVRSTDCGCQQSEAVQVYGLQIVDANILKQYIFQKGFITESAKLKREQEAASSTLQVTHHD